MILHPRTVFARRTRFVPCILSIGLAATVASMAHGQGAPAVPAAPTIKWSAVDTHGGQISVPAADRPSLVMFLRSDQPQSKQALDQARKILKTAGDIQAVVVLSGQQDAQTPANAAAVLGWTGPVVLDGNYAASGSMGVHVWPTTVVVAATGTQLAHLPGISSSYANELDAYLALASGKIDRAALTQRLASSDVVGDTNQQMAARHLQVAQRLMDKGLLEEVQAELTEGLKRQPDNPQLQVAMVRVLLRRGQTKQAMAIADALDGNAVPAWQRNVLKGRIMLADDQWDAALPVLQEAMKLNPEPAEAQYELGRVYAHKGDWQHAAEAFRSAFEATPVGQGLAAPAAK
jgi:tetratricopeptide (TPR) repeat protein